MKPNKEKYILLLLIIFAAMPMWGQDSKEEGDFDIGKIRYTPIAGTTDEVEVKHKKWWSYDIGGNAYSGNITIPDTVSYLGKTYRVTAIGERAFSSSWITAVSIPNSVTDIGGHAFSYSNITSIDIPNSVKNIGDWAFAWCEKFKTITLPDSLLSIGSVAFIGCDSLKSVTIPKTVKHIGKYVAPYDKISISSENPYYTLDLGILYNKDKTILYDTYPSEIVGDFIVPETVKTIADYAFQNCAKLTSVVIPSTVNRIGRGAFYKCTELKSVIFPDNITEIASETFYGCENLANISIPKQVISVGKGAFGGTAWLASRIIYINNVLYYCKVRDAKTFLKGNQYFISKGIVNKITSAKIKVRAGTTSITEGAFDSWDNIGSLSIPSSVQRMGIDALQIQTLTKLNVYWDDPSLVSVRTRRGELATDDVWIPKKCTLIVPKGAKEKYKTAEVWGKFKIKEREK